MDLRRTERDLRVHLPREGPLAQRGAFFMADVQVQCVDKRGNAHEHITHLGGANWKWTVQRVVQSIDSGTNTFFTQVNGKRANVGVINGAQGKYVRTHADGVWTDNLLALPACVS